MGSLQVCLEQGLLVRLEQSREFEKSVHLSFCPSLDLGAEGEGGEKEPVLGAHCPGPQSTQDTPSKASVSLRTAGGGVWTLKGRECHSIDV